MVSAYTPRLRLEDQGDGENSGTWGQRTDQNMNMLDEAMDGFLEVPAASGVTLTALNATTDQSRQRVLKFTGVMAGPQDVVCPAVEKHYIVWNATTGTGALTIKPSGGTGVEIPRSRIGHVWTDGTTLYQAGAWTHSASGSIHGNNQQLHNILAGSVADDAPNVEQIQQGGLHTAAVGGTANALTLDVAPALTSWPQGTVVRGRITATNTTVGGTLNVNSEGNVAIERTPGAPIQPGDLLLGAVVEFFRDTTTPSWLLLNWHLTQAALSRAPTSKVDGLRGSIDAGDTEHDINTTAGWAWDSTYVDRLVLATEITKQIDNAWTAGDDMGGLDAGTVADSTWYARHLIKRSDTGVVDVLLSLSISAPTMPANYDLFRFIGWHRTDGSDNLVKHFQHGDRNIFDVPVQDLASTAIGTSSGDLIPMTVPPGTRPIFEVGLASTTSARHVLVTSPEQADTAPSSTIKNCTAPTTSQVNVIFSGAHRVDDPNSQIRIRASGGGATAEINTMGWFDGRGENA